MIQDFEPTQLPDAYAEASSISKANADTVWTVYSRVASNGRLIGYRIEVGKDVYREIETEKLYAVRQYKNGNQFGNVGGRN